MRFKRKIFIEKGNLDIAPLIDVVFLLLIFFMLTSSYIFQPGIRVELPRAVTSEVLHRELLVITVTATNEVYMNERPISDEELVSRVTLSSADGQPILIRADKKADLGKVIEVWDICRKVNVRQINIATTQ
jgi:biopolymer transport protein ExbD